MSPASLHRVLAGASVDEPEAAFAALFSEAIAELHTSQGGSADDIDSVRRAARLACEAVREGHACADLRLAESIDMASLRRSPLVGDGAGPTPLVLVGPRLYLHRYWRYERDLGERLMALNRPVDGLDHNAAAAILNRLFPAADTAIDWQKLAAATALSRHLCVISGGPGTGKTTTVVRVLAALLSLDANLRIAVAAPTGKAAARLKASIDSQIAALDLPQDLRERLPAQAFTLHRLLGNRPHRSGFHHDAKQPLPYQVVVVDEASMLDLALAARLVAALPANARLILLGDKDQLASVEAGAVYAELSAHCRHDAAGVALLRSLTGGQAPRAIASADDQPTAPAMTNAVIWLDRSYRFAADGGISRLAAAINAGEPATVTAVFASAASSVQWQRALPSPQRLAALLAGGYDDYVDAVLGRADPALVLRRFERYRVLCSTRGGAYGSDALNRQISAHLQRRLGGAPSARWYAGRAVMVTGNDYALRLFNGDIGLALADGQDRLLVYFAGDEGLRAFAPGRLAQVASAFALTVHKSQGSEFDSVDVVVEPTLTRGLSRELLYTAVTRARSAVRLWCSQDLLDVSVQARVQRRSALLIQQCGTC